MAKTLATGTVLAVAKTYGASVNMTAITNSALAGEAVATLAPAHGCVVGDYIEVSSGWGKLDGQIHRVKTVATNDVTLEKFDTNNQTDYPAGTGIGSIRRITAWSNLSQVKSLGSSGGDQQYADVTAIDDVVERKIPTIRSAVTADYEVFDDPNLPWYADVAKASDASTPYGIRYSFPNGSKLVASAYWSLMKVPMITKNEALTTKISVAFNAAPMRYTT